jgi:hypothetical protein
MEIERHKKMQKDLLKIIDDFENETGFIIQDIQLRRSGSTDLSPLKLWGLYISVAPK